MVKKLTQGEIDGIRLVADMLVVRDVIKNVLVPSGVDINELEAHTSKEAPKLLLTEIELEKQLQDVRKYWIETLTNGWE